MGEPFVGGNVTGKLDFGLEYNGPPMDDWGFLKDGQFSIFDGVSLGIADARRLYGDLREIEVSDPNADEGFDDTPEEMSKAMDMLRSKGIAGFLDQFNPAQVKRFMVRLGRVLDDYQTSQKAEEDDGSDMPMVRFREPEGQNPAICDISIENGFQTFGGWPFFPYVPLTPYTPQTDPMGPLSMPIPGTNCKLTKMPGSEVYNGVSCEMTAKF